MVARERTRPSSSGRADTPRILLFDIDGTPVSTGGAGAVAWKRAFDELYGIPADIGEFTDAGMTDRLPDAVHPHAGRLRGPPHRYERARGQPDPSSPARRGPDMERVAAIAEAHGAELLV